MDSRDTKIKWYQTVRGRLLFCFLSGAVFSLPYVAEWAFALTYVSLTAFFWLLFEGTLVGKEFRACLCFCLGMQWTACSWLASMYPLPYFGFSKPVAFLIVAACCAVLPACFALIMAFALQFGRFLPAHPVIKALGYGALWVVAEWLLTLGDMAFPWATVALSQTGCLPLLQTVSLFGAGWLAFFAAVVCALIAEAFLLEKRSLLIAGSALFAGALLLGGGLLLLPVKKGETLPAAAIQGNITTEEKWDESKLPDMFETYQKLTKQAAKAGAKLILLPESAVPVNFEQDGVLHEAFASIASEYDCTVVMGVLRYEGGTLYNSLVAVEPDGSLSDYYNKRNAVPFGEKTPFDAILPDLSPGTDLTVGGSDAYVETKDYRMGCFICFDSVFSGTDRAKADCDLLLLSTNDAWFGDGTGPKQHLRHAKLRAVESGRTILRAGNTGISAVIDRDGRVLTESDLLKQTVLHGDITVYESRTLVSLTGELFPLLSALFLAVCFGVTGVKTIKKRKEYHHDRA